MTKTEELTKKRTNRKFQIEFTSKKLPFWLKNRYKLITILAIIGFIYQFITLSLMLVNDVRSQADIRLWNGFFPWYTVLFTFTFWSNFILLVVYLIYCFFSKSYKLQHNNYLLYTACTYITVVLLVVAFALFPAAVIAKSNVNFAAQNNPITYGALIMPHAPGPIYCIFFSMIVFSLNRQGNRFIVSIGWWKSLLYLSIFFLLYLFMDVILNWIPIGVYYVENGKHIYFQGYTVYSFFTNLNPKLPNVMGGKFHGYGSPINILWYFLGVIILDFTDTCYYAIIKNLYMSNYKLTKKY